MNHVHLAMHPTPEHPFGASIPHLSLLELGVIELLWRGEDRPEMAGMRTLALSMIERERTERGASPLSGQQRYRCEIEAHEPVVAGLRAHGVPAFEEATGGNNYHVCYPHPSGGYILADANLGCWIAGVYVKPSDAGEDDDEWQWSPAEMHDSDLADDADPALVVAWLLENAR